MKSLNFEFLRKARPELADLGGFAEAYAVSDPSSALVKLRTFAEQLVQAIYDIKRLPAPFHAKLNDLLNEDTFRALVPPVLLSKLHTVRQLGNKAAHGEAVTAVHAAPLVQEAFDIARWFFATFQDGDLATIPDFCTTAPKPEKSKGQLQREKKALAQQLARQEVQLAEVLKKLADERKQREEYATVTELEIKQTLEAGQANADALDFNEGQTRKTYIDAALVSAGWDVGPQGKDTEEVGQEVALTGLPTPSGNGYADYVLWGDNHKPLAVVEAKRTSKSAEEGRTQAQNYAESLEKQFGQRPVIFYTNGVDIFIWNDAEQASPPRKIYGFYSKDSLEYLIFQRTNKVQLELVPPKNEIAGRMYQLEAVKRVTERFSEGHRKALVAQATGTGKTRVAISICDVMTRAKWAKRILFLCDRRELRKQANNAFKEFLPTEPRTIVSAKTYKDREQRVYLATYPAMMKCFESFDVGFFDLIVADESHRSIYNRYRDIFRYFDACQVGLTATPIKLLDRNTYGLFGCEDKDPTSNYTMKEAINHSPRYLVPFSVVKVTTKFQREGIKYSKMSDAQKIELEAKEEDAESIEHDAKDTDKGIFNLATNRMILRNLMDNGIRDDSGSLPGKSIVFARNHKHAVILARVFNDLYPKYGGHFCRVIDNYDAHADQLIDDFKDPDHKLRIAISVDMLDTGIDVPEIVNLVFAKPIRSHVKFWQMIGRGTRLRPNLFGLGKDKTEFLIFDHWNNFEFFEKDYKEVEPPVSKSLMQRVFEARVELARVALEKMDQPLFESTIALIEADIQQLKNVQAIEVRDHWHDLQKLGDSATLEVFGAATQANLLEIVGPLMRWCDVRGHEEAYRFDRLVTQLQSATLEASSLAENLQGEVIGQVDALRKNLNQVKAKAETIKKVNSADFWKDLKASDLTEVREDLRGVMKHKHAVHEPKLEPRVIDVADTEVERESHIPTFDGHELIAYRHRVQAVLDEHFTTNPVLAKIRAGEAVSDDDLDVLAHQILSIDPVIDLKNLPIQINVKGDLHKALRSIVGLDAEAVSAAFVNFTHIHTELTAQQIRFLSVLKAHICANGGLEVDRLYEAPFTAIDADGIDGVFEGELIDELLDIIARFNLPDIQGKTA